MTVDIHPLLKDEAEQYPMNQPYYRAGIRGNSVDLYTNKYGTPMELVQKLAPMGERGYIWIDGNRLIQIDGTNLNETFILYYDIRIQEKIKEERKNEAKRQIEEKKDDI